VLRQGQVSLCSDEVWSFCRANIRLNKENKQKRLAGYNLLSVLMCLTRCAQLGQVSLRPDRAWSYGLADGLLNKEKNPRRDSLSDDEGEGEGLGPAHMQSPALHERLQTAPLMQMTAASRFSSHSDYFLIVREKEERKHDDDDSEGEGLGPAHTHNYQHWLTVTEQTNTLNMHEGWR
jgi:hypothetical protein